MKSKSGNKKNELIKLLLVSVVYAVGSYLATLIAFWDLYITDYVTMTEIVVIAVTCCFVVLVSIVILVTIVTGLILSIYRLFFQISYE